MRKLLSLVLAFAMILGLFAFPVSADESMYQAVGQELMNYGVIKGGSNGLAEMDKLTREESLVVLSRLMGQEDKALATEAVADFTDVPATHWAAKYVAYAKLQGWTTGVSEKEFGLGQQVTTRQVVTFMMRALGYKEVKWEEAMTKAKELGLLEGVSAMAEDQIIRGEVFIVMKNTLYTKPMNEKQELIYKLGLKENPVPETLDVVEVEATNLKEVVVTFNQEVDKDTLKDAFRFVGASQGTLTSELKEDGKTVVVTVGSKLKNLKMYKFQVSGVKTLAGVKMEKVVKEFKVADVEAPVVEGIKVTGPRSFQVMFSEPVEIYGKLRLFVNGKASFGLTGAVDTSNRRVVNVKTSTLKDGTTYTVRVEGFQDYAGYTNKIDEKEFDYVKLATAPTLEVVKATQEYVEVKFDRPVEGLKLDNFYHTFSSYKPIAAFENMEALNGGLSKALATSKLAESRDSVIVSFVPDVDKFLAGKDFSGHKPAEWKPLPAGDVKFVVTGKNIVDAWKNKFEEFEQVLNITADKEAPVVESVEVTGENEIVVTFSKKVGVKKDNYEILKEDGSKFDGLKFDVAAEGNTGVKLTVKSPKLVGKTVVLNIKDVKDTTINQNKLVAVESQTLTFGDKTFEGPKEAILYGDTDNKVAKVRIKFDEALNADTATNKKNYKFEGVVKTPDFEVSMFSDKIVELVFTEEEWKEKVGGANVSALPAGFKVVLSNQITDVAGNQFSTFSKTLPVQASTTVDGSKIKMEKVVSTVTDRIVVTFSEEVKKVDDGNQVAFEAKDFKLVDSSSTKYPVGNVLSEEVNEDGKTVVELELDTKKLSPSIDGMQLEITATVKNTLDVEMKAGNKTADITDKIKPEHVKLPAENGKGVYDGNYADYGFVWNSDIKADEPAVAARWNAGKNRYEIVVVYNEPMQVATMSTTTFKVKGFSVGQPEAEVGTSDKVFLIPISADEYKTEMFDDVTVEQVGIITDMKGNALESLKEIVIQEKLKKDFNAQSLSDAVAGAKAALKTLVEKVKPLESAKQVTSFEAAKHRGMVYLQAKATEFYAMKASLTTAEGYVADDAKPTLKQLTDAKVDLQAKYDAVKDYVKNLAPEMTATLTFAPNMAAADQTTFTVAENKDNTYYKVDGTGYYTLDEEVTISEFEQVGNGKSFPITTDKYIDVVVVEGNKVKSYMREQVAEGKISKAIENPAKVEVTVTGADKLLLLASDPTSFATGTESSPTNVTLTGYGLGTADKFKLNISPVDNTVVKYQILDGSTAISPTAESDMPSSGLFTVIGGSGKIAKIKVTVKGNDTHQNYIPNTYFVNITVND